ncbi:MAG: SDR family oxidoreductase [Methylobacter sp.]
MAKILIVGCGKIGSALADMLIAQGHDVTGLKRNPPEAVATRVNYIAADISKPVTLDADFDHAFFIVTPGRRDEQDYRAIYQAGLDNLLDALPDTPWLMVSSTSVYAQSQGEWVDEESVAEPDNAASRLIRQAERRLTAANPANIVVRFSGIYGPGRESLLRQAMQAPAIQRTPPYFTNRIHQQDCVGVLAFLLAQRLPGVKLEQYYLASDDDPAPLWDVVTWLAERLHCPPPTEKTDGDGMNKRCSNARLKALGYRFSYPRYKDGYLELLENRSAGFAR